MGRHDIDVARREHHRTTSISRRPTRHPVDDGDTRGDTGPAASTAASTGALTGSHADAPTGLAFVQVADRSRLTRPATLRRLQIGADAVAIAIGYAAAFVVQGWLRPLPTSIRVAHLVLAVAIVPVWLLLLGINQLYAARAVERASEEIRRLLVSGAITTGALVAIGFVLKYDLLSRLMVGLLFVGVTTALVVERWITRRVFAWLRSSGRIRRRVAVIGTDPYAIGLVHAIDRRPSLGYEVVGFIGDDELGQRAGRTVLAPLDDAVEALRRHGCNGAIVSIASLAPERLNRLTRALGDHGFHVAVSTGLHDIDLARMRPQDLDGQTLVYVEPRIRTGWRRHAKRTFDVSVAALALTFAAPVLVVTAALIKLDSPGPVFFRQLRVGRDGALFPMLKLRTMYVDAEARRAALLEQNEADGPLFKIEHDPRITRVGRVLRRLSIDEVPQFWNVLCGSMSIVGPRPALPDEVVAWDPDLHDRLRVLPGITGMWQVSGRSGTTFEEYRRLDLYYVDNWSLRHDVRIVARTFGAVLLQRGAS